jgi:hypothetical protein
MNSELVGTRKEEIVALFAVRPLPRCSLGVTQKTYYETLEGLSSEPGKI